MEILLYSLIVLLATTIGALAGLGGGVIIKPLLDLMHLSNVAVISLYSSIAVFSMACVSMYKQLQGQHNINLSKVSILAFGSVIGGMFGEALFGYLYHLAPKMTSTIQNILLALIMLLVLIYSFNQKRIKTKNCKNKIIILIIGVILGAISVLCGIGGGPLNLIVLSFFFSMSLKDSVLSSIVIIFFSQGTKIVSSVIDKSLFNLSLEVTVFIIISAIIGGIIGSKLNKQLANKQIEVVYRTTIIAVLLITIVNML